MTEIPDEVIERAARAAAENQNRSDHHADRVFAEEILAWRDEQHGQEITALAKEIEIMRAEGNAEHEALLKIKALLDEQAGAWL